MNNSQNIIVFQQNNSGESKIQGIRKYGGKKFKITTISIDSQLPEVIDNTKAILPQNIQGDLALDFIKHPDISLDLAMMCRERGIPVGASGKKMKISGVITPPT